MGRYVEADVAKVVNRREAVMRNLVDVEGELRLHVGMSILSVRNHRAIFRANLGNSMGTAWLVAIECPMLSPM